jgi:membrane-associated phospholipid phosphatase
MKTLLIALFLFAGPHGCCWVGNSCARADAGTVSDATLATAVAAGILGMPTWEKRGVAAGAQVLNFGLNYGLKYLIRQDRPDGSDDLGMPSGHSQLSMGGAGALCREYGGLPCAGGLLLGATTMVGRLMAGRHTIAQVGVGGMIGLAGTYYGLTLTGIW